MHTVHFPKEPEGGFIAAAVGIMFSTTEYTADLSPAERYVIDAFFDGLKWDESGAIVSDLILYGDLMEMVDSNNRWIYKGSVTTPPCATFVYWNVLSTIYPVSKKHLDKFVNTQLAQGEDGMLDDYGNWREIQEVDEHAVIYVQDIPVVEEEIDNTKYTVTIVILAIVAFIGIVVSTIQFFLIKNEQKVKEEYKEAISARS
jgi:hypothetical protein